MNSYNHEREDELRMGKQENHVDVFSFRSANPWQDCHGLMRDLQEMSQRLVCMGKGLGPLSHSAARTSARKAGVTSVVILSLASSTIALGCQLPTGDMLQAEPSAEPSITPLFASTRTRNVDDLVRGDQARNMAQPHPFRATYRANYKGLPLRANGLRQLIHEPDGSYRLFTKASAMFISVSEETQFRVNDGRIEPVSYLYQRKGLGRSKTESQQFDTEGACIRHEDGASTVWPEGAYDKLLFQLQMKQDISISFAEGRPWPDMNYTIVDGKQVKNYQFKVVGTETLETPIGQLTTVKVARVRENNARETIFWLSPEHDFLLVQLRQSEPDGSGFELYLQDLEH